MGICITIKRNERTVAPAHFFGAEANRPTVSYLLNQGYCNAKCGHCYINKIKHKPLRRSVEQAREDIQSLRGQGYRVLLRGTEILTHKEFLSLFPLAGQNYLQTNGKEIVRDTGILDEIASYGIKFMIISYPFGGESLIDSKKEEINEVVKMAAKKFGVTLSMIVTKKTAHHIELLQEFCELAISLGAKGAKFIRLIPIVPELSDETPNTNEAKQVLSEIARLKRFFKKEILTLQTPGCFGLFEFRRSLDRERFRFIDISLTYDCPAGIKNFVIDVDNLVYPCIYLMTDDMQIGIFKNGTIFITHPDKAIGRIRTEESAAFRYWHQKYGNMPI